MIITCEICQSKFKTDSSLRKATGSVVRCSKCRAVFRVFPLPTEAEFTGRRKYTRVRTRNLIAHVSTDETGNVVSQGLSKAINVSRGGMLLKTPQPIESGLLSLMAVDLDNNLIEVKGKLIYSGKLSTGMYLHGIVFIGPDEQVEKFVAKLIREYNHRKNHLCWDLSE